MRENLNCLSAGIWTKEKEFFQECFGCTKYVIELNFYRQNIFKSNILSKVLLNVLSVERKQLPLHHSLFFGYMIHLLFSLYDHVFLWMQICRLKVDSLKFYFQLIIFTSKILLFPTTHLLSISSQFIRLNMVKTKMRKHFQLCIQVLIRYLS